MIELIVAVGLFALIMTLSTGAYLIMISVNRQTQGLATGINNLSFVLDSMTVGIRTGSAYCSGGYCVDTVPGSSFSYRDQAGNYVRYALVGTTVESCTNPPSAGGFCAPNVPLTAPAVSVSSLTFVPSGSLKGDGLQPYVTIYMAGTVLVAPGKIKSFAVESSAVMRGSDI